MNFFSFLPKIEFESTIGTFNISSFFTFYDYDSKKLNLTTKTVDNKTTLTELSQKVYKDNNSIWMFLIANGTTDPFKVLSTNPSLFLQKIKDNISLGLYPESLPTGNYVNPVGSLLTPYSATGGSAWQYSSVGNFDLNGAFTLIDSTDYFTGKMVIKEQKGGTKFIAVDATNDPVEAIQNTGVSYASDDLKYETKDKTTQANDVKYISQKNSGTLYPTDTEYQAFFAITAPPTPSYENTGATFAVTVYDQVLNQDKTIYIINPSSVSFTFNNLKTLSYT